MAALSNPYIAGNPVRGQINFVGRQDILRDVQRVLRDPDANAIVLYGQRRIGKTSILFQLEQQLAESGAYLPVYFDLHDKTDLSLAEILYRLATQIARYVDVSGLDRAQFDDEGSFFRSDFLPRAVQRTNKQLILLFDEFDTLDRPYKGQVSATFLPYLQRWMSRTGDVHFVLAMGRRPEDLSPHMLNAFRHVQGRHVSLMDLAESLAIVRQSEHNHTLYWAESGVNRICYWTQGHPYLTQLLCSEVWEEAHDDAPDEPPTVTADEVDLAVEATLEQGANAFQWIWNGLPPSERLAMAAMAGTGKLTITREQLQAALQKDGVRLLLPELELAPENLLKWDLLRRTPSGYRFAIPLLQRWVMENKPLRRVKAELDSVGPQAEKLFRQAVASYKLGDLEDTERLLRRAMAVNPNHVQARLLEGRVHLAHGRALEAVAVTESAYRSDPAAARQGLVAALLSLAETQADQSEQWRTLNRVLRIDPAQPQARERQALIMRGWAEKALAQGDYEAALHAYEEIGDAENSTAVRRQMRRQALAARLPRLARSGSAK
jgi:tetratricopeptide (TPR) repeat protein